MKWCTKRLPDVLAKNSTTKDGWMWAGGQEGNLVNTFAILTDANTDVASQKHMGVDPVSHLVTQTKDELYSGAIENTKVPTTSKIRTGLHGQFANRKKCWQLAHSHKSFIMLKSNSEPEWFAPEVVLEPRGLTPTEALLPTPEWPADHCGVMATVVSQDKIIKNDDPSHMLPHTDTPDENAPLLGDLARHPPRTSSYHQAMRYTEDGS